MFSYLRNINQLVGMLVPLRVVVEAVHFLFLMAIFELIAY